MKTVSEILRIKQKPHNIIDAKAKVIDALVMMNTVNLSYLIAMDHDEFKGIFSERDYTRNVILKKISGFFYPEALTTGPTVNSQNIIAYKNLGF
jgi:hypothetical protein